MRKIHETSAQNFTFCVQILGALSSILFNTIIQCLKCAGTVALLNNGQKRTGTSNNIFSSVN